MMDVAVFGAGRMGKVHAGNVRRHPAARVKYVIDVMESAAQAVAASVGAQVGTLETVLADKDVKAVVITSPTATHLPLSVACARAGKAIFCEKPIDLALDRVVECVAEVERTGVPFQLGFQRRFDPTFRALHDAVASGAIGDVEIVKVTSRDPYPPPRGYVATSGGIFRDMMIHDFDVARWFLGEEPVEVFAWGSCLVSPMFAELSDADTAMAMLKTASGRMCHIENSRRAVYGYDQRIEVFGSKGMLQAGNRTATSTELWNETGIVRDKILPFFPERYVEAYAAEIAAFLDAVTQGKAPEVGAVAGQKSLVLADAATRSFQSGQPVKIA